MSSSRKVASARPNEDLPTTRSVRSGSDGSAGADDEWPGRAWGLPAAGAGSVARLPRRSGQFLLDLVIAGLVAAAVQFPAPQWLGLTVWALLVTVPVALLGQTPAMVLTGLRVARVDGAPRVGLWALARTVSLFFVVPALITDPDARGLHDRVSRTVVLRTR